MCSSLFDISLLVMLWGATAEVNRSPLFHKAQWWTEVGAIEMSVAENIKIGSI